MVYNFLDKKPTTTFARSVNLAAPNKFSGDGIKNEYILDEQLSKVLKKPIIRKLQKRKVLSSFIYKIWGADHTDMQLISKFKKELVYHYMLLIFFINMHGFFL